MTNSFRNPKTVSRSLTAAIQIAVGCLTVFISAVMLVSMAAGALLKHEISLSWPALICFLLGVALIWAGVGTFLRISLYRRIMSLTPNPEGVTLEALARRLGLSQKKLLRELRKLVNQGFWQKGIFSEESITLTGYDQPDLIILAGDGKFFRMKHASPFKPMLITQRKKDGESASPKRTERSHERERAQQTPSGDREGLLRQARTEIKKIAALDLDEHAEICSQAQKLRHIAELILEQLGKEPEKIRRSRQFLRYYLPSAANLLVTYEDLSRQGYHGGNVKASMDKIESSMPSIEKAFLRELDSLYQDKSYDIAAEISVLESIIEKS